MASELPIRTLSSSLTSSLKRARCPSHTTTLRVAHRSLATEAESDLESRAALNSRAAPRPSSDFDPVMLAQRRQPGTERKYRNHVRSPRYYRGPLHPVQPPVPSDPHSRLFRPGALAACRLQETYHDTFASDLMTLSYTHNPYGHERPIKGERLRRWVGDSPYFKNRPLRGPRGDSVLRPIRKPITFRNIPRLERVVVHTQVSTKKDKNSGTDKSPLMHVASMALQAMTGVKPEPHKAKHSVNQWSITKGEYVSLTCELVGPDAWDFLARCVDVVMPKIKDWPGVKGSSGDSTGNITFGLRPEDVALFPEIEVNYNAYPTQMIPGCHITLHTSANNDRDARLLLSALGVPFYGKLVN